MRKVRPEALPAFNRHIANEYDGVIATVGFEERARFIPTKLLGNARSQFACAFDKRKTHSFKENLDWFRANGFEIEESDNVRFKSWCESRIEALVSESDGDVTVGIDVSSMSRFRIATLFEVLLEERSHVRIIADFLYAPAEFKEPIEFDTQMEVARPVTDTFAGWSTRPELPTAAVLGLGYEQDKAIGVIEYIEPTRLWAFRPIGDDERYQAAMDGANESLWDILPKDDAIEYTVSQPYECVVTLESLIFGSFNLGRPVLIPFGPKIFCVCCLAVASIHYPRVAVWRVSSDQSDEPIDQRAAGTVFGLRIVFLPE
jgi:hypothetical protein